jgi:hypothetical protein
MTAVVPIEQHITIVTCTALIVEPIEVVNIIESIKQRCGELADKSELHIVISCFIGSAPPGR